MRALLAMVLWQSNAREEQFRTLLAVSLALVQCARLDLPRALTFLRWTRRGKDLQKEHRKQQRKAQVYGEHIDQHI